MHKPFLRVFSTLLLCGVGMASASAAQQAATPNEARLEKIRTDLFGDASETNHFQKFFFTGKFVSKVPGIRARCLVTANSSFSTSNPPAQSTVLFDIQTRKPDHRIRKMELFNESGSSPIPTEFGRFQGNIAVVQSRDPDRSSKVTLAFSNPADFRTLQSISVVLNETDRLPSHPQSMELTEGCVNLKFILMLDDQAQNQMAEEAVARFRQSNPGTPLTQVTPDGCDMNLKGDLRCSFDTALGGDEPPTLKAKFAFSPQTIAPTAAIRAEAAGAPTLPFAVESTELDSDDASSD